MVWIILSLYNDPYDQYIDLNNIWPTHIAYVQPIPCHHMTNILIWLTIWPILTIAISIITNHMTSLILLIIWPTIWHFSVYLCIIFLCSLFANCFQIYDSTNYFIFIYLSIVKYSVRLKLTTTAQWHSPNILPAKPQQLHSDLNHQAFATLHTMSLSLPQSKSPHCRPTAKHLRLRWPSSRAPLEDKPDNFVSEHGQKSCRRWCCWRQERRSMC